MFTPKFQSSAAFERCTQLNQPPVVKPDTEKIKLSLILYKSLEQISDSCAKRHLNNTYIMAV